MTTDELLAEAENRWPHAKYNLSLYSTIHGWVATVRIGYGEDLFKARGGSANAALAALMRVANTAPRISRELSINA